MIVRAVALMTGSPAVLAPLLALAACGTGPPDPADLDDFGTRYAAAWSSGDPARLASFYAEDGALVVNGTVHRGRDAIRETAAGFMAAFPDMRVTMDSVVDRGAGHAAFYWTWTGTNTGPGGTGRAVDLRGYEEWTFAGDDGIARSDGHYDEDEYRIQVTGDTK